MQRLDLPQALEDIRRKISLIEERLQLVTEGVHLYHRLAQQEKDQLKNYQFRELWMKKREEQIACTEQLHSQKVYLREFENDLENQRKMRQLQLEQMNEHLSQFLKTAGTVLKQHKNISAQDKAVLTAAKDRFRENNWRDDDEKISMFRDLVNTLQKLSKS